MITYRIYQSGDERQLVDKWNVNLTSDPITSKRFRNLVLLDANFDPKGMRIASIGDEIVGCVYAVRRLLPMIGTELDQKDGWIPFFFVDKDYRSKGIGKRLMKEAIGFLQGDGRENVLFSSYAPNYILPGIDEKAYPDGNDFLIEQGFKKLYSPIAMDKSLVNYKFTSEMMELKNKRESEGYSFDVARDKDLYELVQFATHTFNPDWGRAIREGILQGLPLEQILVAKLEKRIVGFCIYGGHESIPERFGPFGVGPDQQGKRLGKLILNLCLQQMKSEGLHGAWFLWTGEKTSAGYLYKKTGFEITRTFNVMKKEI